MSEQNSDNSLTELRVTMERVAGDVRLINERLENLKEQARDAKERLHSHSNRIGILEAVNQMRKGALAMWTAISGLVVAVGGVFFKMMGWV